jgi:predicted Rossmann-fold nucleotide-binding protein
MCTEYWAGLVEWLRTKMLGEHNYITPEDLDVFTMVDDVHTAVRIIKEFKESPSRSGIDLPSGMKKT